MSEQRCLPQQARWNERNHVEMVRRCGDSYLCGKILLSQYDEMIETLRTVYLKGRSIKPSK